MSAITQTPEIPPHWQPLIQARLGPDEKLVWARQPVKGAFKEYGRLTLLQIIVIGFFGFMGLLLIGLGIAGKAGGFGVIGALIFGLILLGSAWLVAYAPRLVMASLLKKMYVLTNQRAFILSPNGAISQTFKPASPEIMSVMENPDGSGDLVLGYIETSAGEGNTKRSPLGFFGLPDVKEVAALVKQTLFPSLPR